MFGIKFKEIDLQKMPIKKIVIIGQFLIILFCVRTCHIKDLTINNKGVELKMYEGKTNEFETTKNKLGEKIALQDQMIVQKDKAIEKELLKNSLLTKLNEQVKFEASTKIKNFIANYSGNGTEIITVHDTIKLANGKDSIETIEGVKIGTAFKADTSKWYKIAGTIQKQGVKFDLVSFQSDFTMNVGEKRVKGIKGWLLGKKEAKVELINTNPYTTIDVMKNVKLVDKKWYQNGWLKFGAGVLIGGAIISYATH
jgi:hypothetical protein